MTYIPDMTERFPEGMRGEDLTGDYFYEEGYMPEYDEDEIGGIRKRMMRMSTN